MHDSFCVLLRIIFHHYNDSKPPGPIPRKVSRCALSICVAPLSSAACVHVDLASTVVKAYRTMSRIRISMEDVHSHCNEQHV